MQSPQVAADVNAMERLRREEGYEDDLMQSPEAVAYVLEEAVRAGVKPQAMESSSLRRLIHSILDFYERAVARLMGTPEASLNLADAVDLAWGAAFIELNGIGHSSPSAPFDRFDMNKVLSGEGVLAWGWGIYFSTKPAVSRAYMSEMIDIAERAEYDRTGDPALERWAERMQGTMIPWLDVKHDFLPNAIETAIEVRPDYLQDRRYEIVVPKGKSKAVQNSISEPWQEGSMSLRHTRPLSEDEAGALMEYQTPLTAYIKPFEVGNDGALPSNRVHEVVFLNEEGEEVSSFPLWGIYIVTSGADGNIPKDEWVEMVMQEEADRFTFAEDGDDVSEMDEPFFINVFQDSEFAWDPVGSESERGGRRLAKDMSHHMDHPFRATHFRSVPLRPDADYLTFMDYHMEYRRARGAGRAHGGRARGGHVRDTGTSIRTETSRRRRGGCSTCGTRPR